MITKVAHIITRLDHGGSARNTMLTALGHARDRYEPVVIAGWAGQWIDQGGDAATRENLASLQRAGIRTVMLHGLTRELNAFHDAMALLALWRLLRREKPMIVHTHTSKAGVVGRLAARLAKVPIIVHTPHGHVFYGHFSPLASAAAASIERWLARCTTQLIALTAAERDEHLARRIGRPDRFTVAPSGIDLEKFRAVARRRRRDIKGLESLPADAFVIGSVGWLTEVKGHRVLIEALARIKAVEPRACAVIVGSGKLLSELQARAGALGVGGSVRWLGERDDIPDCLAAMDVFVLPSLNEGMGRALVEAMAAGRPVVASRVGGVPAIVTDRKNGRLIPAGVPAALAEAILELHRRPTWANELAAAGHESIGPQYGVNAMVAQIEAVYDQALREVGRA